MPSTATQGWIYDRSIAHVIGVGETSYYQIRIASRNSYGYEIRIQSGPGMGFNKVSDPTHPVPIHAYYGLIGVIMENIAKTPLT